MLKPEKNDRSAIGVHYVDACLKPLKSGVMLRAALDEAGSNLGVRLFAKDGTLWLERPAIPSPFSS